MYSRAGTDVSSRSAEDYCITLGELGLTAWLFASFCAFSNTEPISLWRSLLFGLVFAGTGMILRNFENAFSPKNPWLALVNFPVCAVAAIFSAAAYLASYSQDVWLVVVLSFLCL